jgi:predicted RNase H-like nuclease (RuvC/YqgF family)
VKRKRYSRKFPRMAVERLRTCDDVKELAQELGVTRRCLYKWRAKLETIEPGEDASRPSTHTSSYRKQIRQLKRMLAEKAMEVDFFKGALQKSRLDARRKTELAGWHLRSNARSDVIARQLEYRAHV